MNTKKTIRKILFVGIWLSVGTGMLFLLIAAIGKQKKDTCSDYVVTIKAAQNAELFMDEAGIIRLVKAAAKGPIKGQPKSDLQLWKMEQLLEDNGWIKDARLYFDNNDVLHIRVEERQPVARVFTGGGRSFYIDEAAVVMQLSDKVSARVPVFTGFPEKRKGSDRDSLLLADIRNLASLINQDSFWTAQVSQIDISFETADAWQFEMVPLVGNHSVRLGDGKNMEAKLHRLFVFYKEVLSKTGFEKYKTVDVRFAGQVVAGKSENPKVDQAQLRKAVENMLKQIKEAEQRSEAEANAASPKPIAMNTVGNKPDTATKNAGPKAVMPGKR